MSESTIPAAAPTPAKRSHSKKPAAPATAASKPAPKAKAASEEQSEADSALGSMLKIGSAPLPTGKVVEEEVIENVGLPPTMDVIEDVKGTAVKNCFMLSVYDAFCFECSALVPSLTDPEEKGSIPECHFTLGNEHCPAAYHKIQIVGVRLRHLGRIRKAMKSGDSNRILLNIGKLDKLPLEDKKFVMKELGLLQPGEAKLEQKA